jgi:eukaryotic-like serine/threonine-protein kinase
MTTTMTTSTVEPANARFVDEHYEVGDLLGWGAMGQVFAARDIVLGVDVALKVMNPELADSEEQVALFMSEARMSGRIRSPYVVKVIDVVATRDGAPVIVYERLVGETLGERLGRDGGLSLGETVEIVKQVSIALGRSHRSGVMHRDVKPDNIFLTKDTHGKLFVKLFDFGIAAVADEQGLYAHTPAAGTPEYMAPEVLLGTHVLDSRADLYALGVVAFECLTGQVPFPGELEHVLERLIAGDRADFSAHRPDLDGPFSAWIDRALDYDPAERFETARDLRDSLDEAMREATTRAIRAASIAPRHAA